MIEASVLKLYEEGLSIVNVGKSLGCKTAIKEFIGEVMPLEKTKY